MQISRRLIALHAVLILFSLSTAFRVTGATEGHNVTSGARPFRLDLESFVTSGPAFDLYIQAMNQMQAMNQSDPLSYFQIAGIHGYPQVPWDGVQGTNLASPGFCMHGATPFPPWHRPYLALFEQLIWEKARVIAQTYPEQQRPEYETAATTLRIPYWDWAVHSGLPMLVQIPTVIINTPNGRTTVDNPLYDYNFQPSNDNSTHIPPSFSFSNFPWTVRHFNATIGGSDQAAASAQLQANAGTIVAKTYELFTDSHDYSTFSCVQPNGISNAANNIEMIHGNIHNFVGGDGHMTFPEISAFDPIFWLHHANVDRLFAMWQVLNPESYVVPAVNSYGSYYEVPGTVDSGNSSLAPFHSDDGTTLWTNDAVRDLAVFNYAYPELPDWSMNATALASYVRTQVNQKYNPSVPTAQRRIHRRALRNEDTGIAFRRMSSSELRALSVNNADVQWTIRVVTDRYAYSTAFSIDFFLGAPPEDIRTWSTAPNLVGTQSAFIADNMFATSGTSNGISQGEVSLTHILLAAVDQGYLPNLSAECIVPILKEQLTWRARLPDGCELNVSSIKGLAVSVGSKSAVPAIEEDQFPRYGQMVWHQDAVNGKPGGKGCETMVRGEWQSRGNIVAGEAPGYV